MYNIQLEQILAQKYHLTKYQTPIGDEILALTRDNVARIEAILSIDSNYKKSGDAKLSPIIGEYNKSGNNHKKGDKYIKYMGSSAFWLTKLKELRCTKNIQTQLDSIKKIAEKWSNTVIDGCIENNHDNYPLDVAIYGAVCAVDSENSTHLSADSNNNKYGNGRIELTMRLLNMWNNLENRLLRRDYRIVYELANKTNNGIGRQNYAFATKFCHYACYYWFIGRPEQDNYSICDNVLRKAVVMYANIFELYNILNQGIKFTEDDFDNYALFSSVVDMLRNNYGEHISRNGFDHLLWYYYKG